jgi:excisionase family DNA binding protein
MEFVNNSDIIEAFRRGETVFLKVAEMATIARVSDMTIYREIHNGNLGAQRYGRAFRIPVESARRYLQPGNAAGDNDGPVMSE